MTTCEEKKKIKQVWILLDQVTLKYEIIIKKKVTIDMPSKTACIWDHWQILFSLPVCSLYMSLSFSLYSLLIPHFSNSLVHPLFHFIYIQVTLNLVLEI